MPDLGFFSNVLGPKGIQGHPDGDHRSGALKVASMCIWRNLGAYFKKQRKRRLKVSSYLTDLSIVCFYHLLRPDHRIHRLILSNQLGLAESRRRQVFLVLCKCIGAAPFGCHQHIDRK